MKLTELLNGLTVEPVAETDIGGLTLDSRAIKPGDLFVAMAGSQQHGLSFYPQVKASGAKAIVYDPADGGQALAQDISDIDCYPVKELAQHLGQMAARFYGHPSRKLTVIGITGTNGKTSCSQFLAQLLPDCAVVGTLGWGRPGQLNTVLNTTPDAISVQKILAQCVEQGVRYVAMEVSSHGLAQGRVNGVVFKLALFTNLSRDHLDYHGSMTQYLREKQKLFHCQGLATVVLNRDDPATQSILANIPPDVAVWGVGKMPALKQEDESILIEAVENGLNGQRFDLCWKGMRQTVQSQLTGDFNVDNSALVGAALLVLGWSLPEVADKLQGLQAVRGRMEKLGGGDRPVVVIDYAHTPDALDKLLGSLQPDGRRLIVVFGCGGDRDQGKRRMMGEVASRWADTLIVTNDNPRSEAPEAIAAAVLQGCDQHKTRVILDRAAAINIAITQANPGDCVVIAGKGHEQYQEINGVKMPFSDQTIVKQALSGYLT